VSQGNDVRCLKLQGFHGKKAGGVFVGHRYDGSLVQLTGSDARDSWKLIMPHQTNVTRIDLQVTIEFVDPQKRLIVKAYNKALRAPKVKGRAPEYKLITTSREGDTLYFGAPSSDIKGRMYDKGIESKCAPAGRVVRYEIQARRDIAKRTAAALDASASQHDYVGETVAGHFRKRHIVPPRFALKEVEGARVETRSDDARRLAYLRTVGRGMVERCLRTYSRAQILEALGLEYEDSTHYQ
jgi:DNA relaxase NicK